MTDLPPTRAAGEDLLAAFAPRMGRRYANGRNTDHGPGGHKAVSSLSPYIRRRLILDQDAVAAALAAHGPGEAEKFVQEVIWRGYFKGWPSSSEAISGCSEPSVVLAKGTVR